MNIIKIIKDKCYYIAKTEVGLAYHKDINFNLLHREDGPAIELMTGYKAWYLDGVIHRVNGPAVESSGNYSWYLNGKLHREDGPAIEFYGLSKSYYFEGVIYDHILNDEQWVEFIKTLIFK